MLCFVFAALVVLLDQLFKRWVVLTLTMGGESVLIPGIINIMHVENTGAAFSILPNQRWLLAGIALVAAIILIAILLRYDEGFWGTLGLASVLGGTVGNLIDRLFHGYVVDMFRTTFMDFAVFNIADIFITLGGITFCVFFIISSVRSGRNEDELPEPEEAGQIEEQHDAYDYQEEQDEIDYDKLFYDNTYPIDYPEQDRATPPVYYKYEQEQPGYYTDSQDIPVYAGSAAEEPVYYEPVPDPPAGNTPALDALESLESELTGLVEDYDLDDLLREYGFEDDSN